MTTVRALALTAVITLGACAVADAAVWHVANNGVDAPLCGSRNAPCRSISAAIARAEAGDRIVVGPGRYGDVNGDGDFDDPGDEAAELQDGPGCGCLIHVNKILTIESEEGAGATVLDASGRPIYVVRISISEVVFGRRDKGFTLTGGRRGMHIEGPGLSGVAGVRIESNRSTGQTQDGFSAAARFQPVRMLGNVASANGRHGVFLLETRQDSELTGNTATDNGGAGFFVIAFATSTPDPDRDLIIRENFAAGNGGGGFSIELTSGRSDISMNVASHNGSTGFAVAGNGSTLARDNAAIANDGLGFAFREDGGLDLRGNAIHGNRLGGVLTERIASLTEIARNNIFGNGATTNCGLTNASGDVLTVGKNYWGAPDGPGPDPADTICDVDPAATIVEAVARDPYRTPVTVGR